jgi:hypothetical protein
VLLRSDHLKATIGRFLINFLGIFVIIMILGSIYKPSDIGFEGIIRAIVISSASSLSWIIGQYIVKRTMLKKN